MIVLNGSGNSIKGGVPRNLWGFLIATAAAAATAKLPSAFFRLYFQKPADGSGLRFLPHVFFIFLSRDR